MVVGGGIGGIQASLDLANSGFKVYLVEEESAIGKEMQVILPFISSRSRDSLTWINVPAAATVLKYVR